MSSEVLKAVGEISDSVKVMQEHQASGLKKIEQRLDGLQERVELVESLGDRPGKGGSDFSADDREHKAVFCDWLRRPRDGMAKRRLEEAQHAILAKAGKEGKAITVGTDSAGGFAVPTEIDREIESRVNLLNPFRSLARVVNVGSRDYKQLVSSNDGSSGWVGEGDSRSETTTARLFSRAPTFGTIYVS